MADAGVLKTLGRKAVRVRVPPPAPDTDATPWPQGRAGSSLASGATSRRRER